MAAPLSGGAAASLPAVAGAGDAPGGLRARARLGHNMLRERKRPAIVFAAACLASLAGGAESLDLEKAIRLALERNRDLAVSALSVEGSRLDVRSAEQEFDVRLKPSGRVDAFDSDAQWQYGIGAAKKLPWGTEVGVGASAARYPSYIDEPWRSAVKVEFRQPLFRDFGSLVHGEPFTAAGERLLAARRVWEQQKADLVVSVVEAFEGIVRLQRQVLADEALRSRTDRLCELAHARERQGRATRVDSLRAELQRGQAASRLEAHREECYSRQRDLAELLGFPPESEFDLTPPPLPSLDVPSVGEAVATALSNRLDFAQAIQDGRANRRAVDLARRALLPDVRLTASHEQFGEDEEFSGSTALREEDWFVGLTADSELYSRRDRTAVRRAEVEAEIAREIVRTKAWSITREVQQALSAYRRARAEFDIAGHNLLLADSRAELARRLFEIGRGDHFAASDAEQAFAEAETQLLAARSAVSIAGYRLLGATGTLIDWPEDLKPPRGGPAGEEKP